MMLPTAGDIGALQGAIFDLDGTLVDSRLDFVVIRAELGCPAGTGVLEFIDALPVTQQRAAHAIVLKHERRGAQQATWMPGAEACLAALARHGIPCAILTRNAREVADLTFSRLNMRIDRLIAREDAPPKPAPDGLLQIAHAWQLPPAELVYVGDFHYDLEAAHRAGMIACYYDPEDTQLYASQADWHIRHFDVLKPANV